MRKKIKLGLSILALVTIISSCSTSSDVASNRKVQKRKYTKGFFVGKNSNNDIVINSKKKNSNSSVKTTEENEEVYTYSQQIVSETSQEPVEVVYNNQEIEPAESNKSQVDTQTDEFIDADGGAEVAIVTESEISNKEVKSKVKELVKSKKDSSMTGGDVSLIVLILLAIFIPPLAVYLYEDITTRFWISLVLYILFITWLISTIYAILIVTGTI